MTIPFCESRSTRISHRTRGHSHSVTRQAMLWGSSSSHPVEQLLADQVGHPEGLGHVGDHPLGVVARALGHPGHHRVDQGGDPLAGGGRHREVLDRDRWPAGLLVERVDHRGHRGQMAEDSVAAHPVDLVDHHQQGRGARLLVRRRRWPQLRAQGGGPGHRPDPVGRLGRAPSGRPGPPRRWPRPWPPPRRRRPATRWPTRSSARPARSGACAGPGCRRTPPGRRAGSARRAPGTGWCWAGAR